MRRLNIALIALFCCLSLSLNAQQYQPKRVTFSGYKNATNDELFAASGLKKGDTIGSPEINAAAQKLSDTGLFESIKFKFDGEELHFDLKPAPNIFPIEFDNFPWWSDSELLTQLHTRIPFFHGALTAQSGLQQQISDALTAMLSDQHIAATIEAAVAVDRKTGTTTSVRFHVSSPSVVFGSVTFNGASPANAPDLDPIARAAAGQTYASDSAASVLSTAVINVFHNKGYLEVTTGGFAHQAPGLSGDKISVPVSLNISEGTQYHLGKLILAGDVLMTQDEFLKHAYLHPGDIASEEKLRLTMAYVAAPYRSKGYLRSRITGRPAFNRDQQTVDYTISVTPGEVFHMGTIKIENLNDDQQAAFLKVWKLKPGDPFDPVYEATVLKQNTSLRILDGYSASYKNYENEDTHIVDVVYTFHKGGPLS